MKFYILITFFFSLGFSGHSQENKSIKKTTCIEDIYICNSIASKTYHYTINCNGLKHCKDTIRSICKYKAEKVFGRVLCGFETSKD